MPTITSSEIIKNLLENNGVYSGDPQVCTVWKFIHAITQQETYAIFYDERHDMFNNYFCPEPILLFSAGRITPDGRTWLEQQNAKCRY